MKGVMSRLEYTRDPPHGHGLLFGDRLLEAFHSKVKSV